MTTTTKSVATDSVPAKLSSPGVNDSCSTPLFAKRKSDDMCPSPSKRPTTVARMDSNVMEKYSFDFFSNRTAAFSNRTAAAWTIRMS